MQALQNYFNVAYDRVSQIANTRPAKMPNCVPTLSNCVKTALTAVGTAFYLNGKQAPSALASATRNYANLAFSGGKNGATFVGSKLTPVAARVFSAISANPAMAGAGIVVCAALIGGAYAYRASSQNRMESPGNGE